MKVAKNTARLVLTHVQSRWCVGNAGDVGIRRRLSSVGAMAVCLAVISKQNSPLYIVSTESETEMQWKVHTALDMAEERLTGGTRTSDLRDLYLGLLYSTEAHNIYGYVTNTRVKLLAVVGGGGNAKLDTEVRSLLRNLHSFYADAICCPFYIPGETITSKVFDKKVRSLLVGSS